MKTTFAIHLVAACAIFTLANPVFAQQTPYAGQQNRAIKSLSAQETQDLLEGRGMGLAKAAELNGYPGPMHVLEMGWRLDLTPAQKLETQALLTLHKQEVRALGVRLVEAETALDMAFVQKTVDAVRVDELTLAIAQLHGSIRAAHLKTHLKQTAMLSNVQIARYNDFRGYTR